MRRSELRSSYDVIQGVIKKRARAVVVKFPAGERVRRARVPAEALGAPCPKTLTAPPKRVGEQTTSGASWRAPSSRDEAALSAAEGAERDYFTRAGCLPRRELDHYRMSCEVESRAPHPLLERFAS